MKCQLCPDGLLRSAKRGPANVAMCQGCGATFRLHLIDWAKLADEVFDLAKAIYFHKDQSPASAARDAVELLLTRTAVREGHILSLLEDPDED